MMSDDQTDHPGIDESGLASGDTEADAESFGPLDPGELAGSGMLAPDHVEHEDHEDQNSQAHPETEGTTEHR